LPECQWLCGWPGAVGGAAWAVYGPYWTAVVRSPTCGGRVVVVVPEPGRVVVVES
jgi:hypothetical protein